MTTIAFAAPILEGKLQVAKNMASLINGDSNAEAVALRKSAGLDREQVFVQHTPMGDFAIVVWDTADPAKVFETWATDKSEHAVWFRAQLQEIHGFDIADKTNVPTWEVLGDWSGSDWKFDKFDSAAVCFPVAAGKEGAARTFVSNIVAGGSHYDEYVSTREEYGIVRQLFSLLKTPNGYVAIMYGEGKEGWFNGIFQVNATSDAPFFSWFREGVMTFAGVPLFEGAKTPDTQQVLHLTVNVPANV